MEGGDKEEEDLPDSIRDVELFNWHPDVVNEVNSSVEVNQQPIEETKNEDPHVHQNSHETDQDEFEEIIKIKH